jgi:predicted RNase H-like HicB family nuclease
MEDKKHQKVLKYEVIFEEAEEGGYTAYVPSLPGCISEGDTFEETKKNISEAILAYLESLAKDNEEIFNPSKNFFIGSVEIPFSKLSFIR